MLFDFLIPLLSHSTHFSPWFSKCFQFRLWFLCELDQREFPQRDRSEFIILMEKKEIPSFLGPLRLFELSCVFSLLSPSDKLLSLACLNSQWHSLIYKSFFWKRVPKTLIQRSFLKLSSFLNRFADLNQTHVPSLSVRHIHWSLLSQLESAASLEFLLHN